MASKNYGIVSSHFSGKSQNCFSSIEDVEALSARSATFAKVLKRIVYGTRFTVTRSRRTNIANVVYTKISLLGFNAAARDGDCNRVRVEENLGRRQRQRWVTAKTTTEYSSRFSCYSGCRFARISRTIDSWVHHYRLIWNYVKLLELWLQSNDVVISNELEHWYNPYIA